MKILADENFPAPVVATLRESGVDVLSVRTEMPGATDEAVLQRAQRDQRIVATFDKDFGELAFRFGLPATCGILLFRLEMKSPDQVKRRVLESIGQQLIHAGNFTVIEESRIRVRALPEPRSDGPSQLGRH